MEEEEERYKKDKSRLSGTSEEIKRRRGGEERE